MAGYNRDVPDVDYNRLNDHDHHPKNYGLSYPTEPISRGRDVFRYDSDNEAHNIKKTKQVKQGFISKVYGVVYSQLTITSIVTLLWLSTKFMRNFLVNNDWFFLLCIFGALITEIMIFYCTSFAKKIPNNYIFLCVFTFFESIAVAALWAISNDFLLVFIAESMACLIVAALTLYAFWTNEETTTFEGFILVLVPTMVITLLFLVIFQSWTLNIIYCGLAVLLFGIFLIVDTQMIKEGKYDSISEDDYIIGALFIYIDIILLLNKILSFLQKSKRRRIRRK